MEIHVATIKDAKRRKNEAFDSVLVLVSVPASETETEKTYKIEMVNNPFLLDKLFDFTDTKAPADINEIIGKTIRFSADGRGAIGHPTENRFVVINNNREFKLEDLIEN